MSENVVFGTYHSVYNKGKYDIPAICKVDLDEKTVFDIEGVSVPSDIQSLDEEYVEVLGKTYEVVIHPDDMRENTLLA